jgi:hypothetical protein
MGQGTGSGAVAVAYPNWQADQRIAPPAAGSYSLGTMKPTLNYLVPTVIEQTHRGERGWDIFSRLLKDRIVFLGTPINDDVATSRSPASRVRPPTSTSTPARS